MLTNNCFSFLNVITQYFTKTTSYINSVFSKENDKFYYLSLIYDNDRGWSIHGLWPQYSKKSYPTYCKVVDFDINKLQPIIEDLHKHWYSSIEKDDEFWKHEWIKHGSCMFCECDELNYFRRALELYITVAEADAIRLFKTSENKAMIPFDKSFNIIYE